MKTCLHIAKEVLFGYWWKKQAYLSSLMENSRETSQDDLWRVFVLFNFLVLFFKALLPRRNKFPPLWCAYFDQLYEDWFLIILGLPFQPLDEILPFCFVLKSIINPANNNLFFFMQIPYVKKRKLEKRLPSNTCAVYVHLKQTVYFLIKAKIAFI